MLGNYVKTYLSNVYEVVCIKRDEFDIETNDWKLMENILLKTITGNDVIINCAGAIPHRETNIRKYISLNTIFPIKLSEFSRKHNLKFIHISTDCIYSGKSGNYDENALTDCDDIYGITKSLGEEKDVCIIRCSIIGEELYNKMNLLEWVKKNANGSINGYENVLWNGITCLQLAKLIHHIIKNKLYWTGVKHIHSPNIVSKYELCTYINEIYNLNINIIKTSVPVKNMTLSSIYNIDYNIPTIRLQLIEQHAYNLSPNNV